MIDESPARAKASPRGNYTRSNESVIRIVRRDDILSHDDTFLRKNAKRAFEPRKSSFSERIDLGFTLNLLGVVIAINYCQITL